MIFNFRLFEIHLKNHPQRIVIKFQRNTDWYRKDYERFKKLLGEGSGFPINDSFPCLDEKYNEAGSAKSHYFIQDLYVAQKIFQRNPQKHVDVGSRVDGFVAHVASFREIELLDVRKMDSTIRNVTFRQADVMDGNTVPEDYCDSASSLHALEHFGLGRYGDPIDPEGHVKGFKNITKMLKKGGIFYFSVPMGKQRIDFNAHRVFGMPYLMQLVQQDYDIISFSYLDDHGEAYYEVEPTDEMIRNSCGCNRGCAIFELRKR
jgi:SAM-dependent methyltransferase